MSGGAGVIRRPPGLLRQLLRVLLRWFPQRQFVCAADGNFATHDLAWLAARYPERLTYLIPAPGEDVRSGVV
jgi:hypothetical protein